jgi:hypothetical protein
VHPGVPDPTRVDEHFIEENKLHDVGSRGQVGVDLKGSKVNTFFSL